MNNATTQCKIHRAIACWLEIHHANVTIDDIQCNDNAIVHLKHHYDIATGCDLDLSLVGKLESWNLRHRVHQLVGANANTQLTVAAAAEPGDTHTDRDCSSAFDVEADCTPHSPSGPTPAPDDSESSGSIGTVAGGIGGFAAIAAVLFVTRGRNQPTRGRNRPTRQHTPMTPGEIQKQEQTERKPGQRTSSEWGEQSLLLRDIRF